MDPFTRYLALGDSISIDYYPSVDFAGESLASRRSMQKRLGAASLFFRNDDEVHPSFRGRDLATMFPSIRFDNQHDGVGPTRRESDNLTLDGAMTPDVLDDVRILEKSDERAIVTLTIGGNDLLGAVRLRGDTVDSNPPRDIARRLHAIVAILLEKMPKGEIVIGTVYDPTDGTFVLPLPTGDSVDLGPVAHWLDAFNGSIRELVRSDSRLHLADIHEHFLGHGTSAKTPDEFWYWPPSIIEPGVRGASEVRRLWIEVVEGMR